MDDKLFTIDEVSAYFNIPKSTIYKLSQTSKIPSVKIGKQLRFRKSSIDNWLSHNESGNIDKGKIVTKKHILLIDDDQLVLKSIANFLKSHGYNVEPAENGEEALKKASTSHFNLVITDMRMPGIDGIETIKRLRELNQQQNKPITPEIIITGYADPEKEKEAERLGIRDYIYKPFMTNEFISKVEERLEQLN